MESNGITRKPLFWIVFVIFTMICVWFIFRYFHESFSILNVDITMDRSAALSKAETLMQQFNFGPPSYSQAAVFDTDDEFQSYVELEAGGKDAFQSIIDVKRYHPFTWQVRHYHEGETNETTIAFTSEGKPYEFREKLPEDKPGAALESAQARQIGEQAASGNWSIDLTAYTLVEESMKEQPSGRIDHTFEYEQKDAKIEEAPLRLKLVIGGDRLVELDHYYKIPETFTRRYAEMRSSNNTISIYASVVTIILYGLGGCVIGLFILMRQHYVIWKQPLIWGVVVAFVAILAQVNYLPLQWMKYDTAVSSHTFLFRQLFQFISSFFVDAMILFLTFMAAESLTRRAFPQHIQFWQTWSPESGASKAILGRTMASYLLIFCFIGYEVALQLIGKNIPGWWSPSSSLVDPNILATYFPWLSSLAISLHAGFWEECLFRAIPIAGAALIGQRIGYRRTLIVFAFIIQPLVFGSGHANYAAQPSYARIIELIIPSLTFGMLYLIFGLLPAVIMHFAFDAVLMSIPVFTASGLWLDKIIVVVLVLVPVWIILWRRFKAGTWTKIPEKHYNAAWEPESKEEKVTDHEQTSSGVLPQRVMIGLIVLGILGLLGWIMLSDFTSFFTPISTSRTEAKQHGISSEVNNAVKNWRVLTDFEPDMTNEHRFIWQKGGPEIYKKFLGNYLSEPNWRIRFARFEGQLEEKTEEYSVYLGPTGQLSGIFHKLPEAMKGAELSQEEARAVVTSFIDQQYNVNVEQLKEISAIEKKHPNRRDWTFTFQDEQVYPLKTGQARIEVIVGGDEIISHRRYIHVPEEWKRAERQRRESLQLIQMPFRLIQMMLFLAFASIGVVFWTKKKISVTIFIRFFLLLFILAVISFFNQWPSTIAGFSTAEPFMNQILKRIAFLTFPLVGYAFVGIIIGFLHSFTRKQHTLEKSKIIISSIALGSILAGILAVLNRLTTGLSPLWPDYTGINCILSVLQPSLTSIIQLILAVTQILIIVVGIDFLSKGWTQRRLACLFLFLAGGFVLALGLSTETVSSFIASGLISALILSLLYILVFRYHIFLIPLSLAVLYCYRLMNELIYNAFPGSVVGQTLAIIMVFVISYLWLSALSNMSEIHE